MSESPLIGPQAVARRSSRPMPERPAANAARYTTPRGVIPWRFTLWRFRDCLPVRQERWTALSQASRFVATVAAALIVYVVPTAGGVAAPAAAITLTSAPNPSHSGNSVSLNAVATSSGSSFDAPSSTGNFGAGGSHSCADQTGGTIECWGYNGSGLLGDGTQTQRLTPVTVSGISSAVAAATGNRYTCAVLRSGGMATLMAVGITRYCAVS